MNASEMFEKLRVLIDQACRECSFGIVPPLIPASRYPERAVGGTPRIDFELPRGRAPRPSRSAVCLQLANLEQQVRPKAHLVAAERHRRCHRRRPESPYSTASMMPFRSPLLPKYDSLVCPALRS
jgi:hypothetical protein